MLKFESIIVKSVHDLNSLPIVTCPHHVKKAGECKKTLTVFLKRALIFEYLWGICLYYAIRASDLYQGGRGRGGDKGVTFQTWLKHAAVNIYLCQVEICIAFDGDWWFKCLLGALAYIERIWKGLHIKESAAGNTQTDRHRWGPTSVGRIQQNRDNG